MHQQLNYAYLLLPKDDDERSVERGWSRLHGAAAVRPNELDEVERVAFGWRCHSLAIDCGQGRRPIPQKVNEWKRWSSGSGVEWWLYKKEEEKEERSINCRRRIGSIYNLYCRDWGDRYCCDRVIQPNIYKIYPSLSASRLYFDYSLWKCVDLGGCDILFASSSLIFNRTLTQLQQANYPCIATWQTGTLAKKAIVVCRINARLGRLRFNWMAFAHLPRAMLCPHQINHFSLTHYFFFSSLAAFCIIPFN